MPVTIKPSPDAVGYARDQHAGSAKDILAMAATEWRYNSIGRLGKRPILFSSFERPDFEGDCKIVPYANGFIHGIIRAFQQDLHLVIRPDDVWLAIITQFSFYVNAHAEELRKQFVSHDGKKLLELQFPSFYGLPVAKMARMFTCLMEEHIVDDDIRNWIIPDFSTTTDNDIAVASMVMMATMQQYFKFEARTGCGFPSVTLLGEVSDWENIVRRLDLLANYGKQPAEWANLLRPILSRFVTTFAHPDSEELKDFWLHVCHVEGRQSGQQKTYSGWITAFMYWNTEGQRMIDIEHKSNIHGRTVYELDEQKYPVVRKDDVPPGVVEVPVAVWDVEHSVEYLTGLVAGSVGVTVAKNEQQDVREREMGMSGGDRVQPLSGWWMLELARKQRFS